MSLIEPVDSVLTAAGMVSTAAIVEVGATWLVGSGVPQAASPSSMAVDRVVITPMRLISFLNVSLISIMYVFLSIFGGKYLNPASGVPMPVSFQCNGASLKESGVKVKF
jgi:hypothetical protein